ncbi:hypothetical protein AB6A40_010125 [Gnathostoma spinigerum]|uniref:Uncharacterized protein n=1 Tax=Gnathostoma spinigerum TaxID=75299 RepID=A0ABD6EVN4_9BILA
MKKKNLSRSADIIVTTDNEWLTRDMTGNRWSLAKTKGDHVRMKKPVEQSYGPLTSNGYPLVTGTLRPSPIVRSISRKTNLRQSSTTLRLHGDNDGYCSVGRTYEEILPRRSDSQCVCIPELELGYIETVRRPPPKCRPPPPPFNESPYGSNASSNSIDHELRNMDNTPSPRRSDDDANKSRNSGENGRESGYGTTPSRLWNSPLIRHSEKPSYHCSVLEHPNRGIPLNVFTRQESTPTMTYV